MTEKLQMAPGGLDAFQRVYLRTVDERARWIGSQSAEWNGPLRRHSFPVGFDTPGRFPYIPARHIHPRGRKSEHHGRHQQSDEGNQATPSPSQEAGQVSVKAEKVDYFGKTRDGTETAKNDNWL